ncbi:MAG TPA: PEP-CTERM sorting domain-containing protein [Pirellulaceae bacterium]|nr:PEP-CTERM sorting domain-containing protein [Pirellulaceae bacterium]HMO92064.1 PEP-CTERM sorting domain-containing protein [Pirellulaceae bacterium]HMP69940.1 PEP-CTERM sorting domain-containing protein [Pirellulaceae bacterium]
MKLKSLTTLMLCAVLSTCAATAKADYVVAFNNLNLSNTPSNPGYVIAVAPPFLVGTLTSVQANFIIEAGGTGGVWASDFGLFVTNQNSINLAGDGGVGIFQAGGFQQWGAAEHQVWGTGNSGTGGTPVIATLNLANPVVFNGNGGDPNVMLAHLWNSTSQGTWSGTITLVGLSPIPEPSSALALSLACMGLAFVRRRRHV